MRLFKNFSRNFRNSRSAFTLIELLVVIGTILILVAFFVSTGANMQDRAKIAKMKYNLTQISNAIKSFAEDFGEAPDTLDCLVEPMSVIAYASKKGLNMDTARAYLQNLPTKDSNLQLFSGLSGWFCSYFPDNPVNFDGSYSNHVRAVAAPPGSCPGSHSGAYTFIYRSPLKVLVHGANVNTIRRRLLDEFGTEIYYMKKSDGSFILLSLGPDKKLGASEGTLTTWDAGTATYTGTAAEDRDNIVLKGSV